ncbi:MAG: hypothetical protein HOC70_04160, partial [Gammaproteobacteria bacterium]|nr:hypothetical protein [Gammaproteobacteria bacterium]
NSDGELLGSASTELNGNAIASQGRVLLTATDLESLFGIEAWSGPAMLEVSGTAEFDLMSKLTSPSGLVSNTNCVRLSRVHNVEGFDSANMTFVRFINTGTSTITSITANLIDTDGQSVGESSVELIANLLPKQAVWLNRDDLADKFGAQWNGVASMKIQAEGDALKLLNLNFVNGETFFNFSCFESSTSGYVYLMTNSDSANISETHIINTSDQSIDVLGTLYAGTGENLGVAQTSLQTGLIAPDDRIILTATDLELLTGADAWTGPALVAIQSTDTFELMTRLTSPSGLISNTNCVRQSDVHNLEGFDSSILTFVRFINQGTEVITNVTGRLYDIDGEELGSSTILLDTLQPFEATWLNRNQLGELFGVTWNGEATLVVTADSETSLRLLNLNLVNDETFFNFSCYEGSQGS